MIGTVHVLDSSGDVEIRWDTDNAEDCAKAREAVLALKAQGYSFFLVDGTPADEVTAGKGTLSCRRVNAETLLPTVTEEREAPTRGRGRPRKTADEQPVTAVATRPLRGG